MKPGIRILADIYLKMEIFAICRVAVAPLRQEASDRSEITSQLLFGDRVTVLEKTEKWCYVKVHEVPYEGWMDFKQLAEVDLATFSDESAYCYLTPLQVDNALIAGNGTIYHLVPGSILPFYDGKYCTLGKEKYEVKSIPFIPQSAAFAAQVLSTARFYENTPYLWGGRSLFGIDCSGFTQMVFRLNGISILRDASQQVNQGSTVDFLAEAQAGDLAFFDNEEGKIIHVGLMINAHAIIHAAGKVRIDPIDDQGIYNEELGRYTHRLRIIKRFV